MTQNLAPAEAMRSAAGDRPLEFPSVPEDNRVLFFSRDRAEFGFLSHFYPSPIVIDGVDWPTVEHFYQSQKSLDPRYYEAIRACETPNAAKRLATLPEAVWQTKRSWFVGGRLPRPDWKEIKLDLMRRADTTKYAQNPDLARRLLATGEAEIVEDAKHDSFWGIGRDGTGENWAGRIIMEVRAALAARTAALEKAIG
jgi:ribA/ribD-fused uncharacterized protein